MALTALRRHAAAFAVTLVLALVAGPATGAACAHLGDMTSASGHEMGGPAMAHGEMAHNEAPPCHDAPVPVEEAPASQDCASACCAADVPPPVTTAHVLTVSDVPTPLAFEVRGPEATPPVAAVPPTPSPPRPTRLHVEIGRFLI